MKLKTQNKVLKAVVGTMCLLLVAGGLIGLAKASSSLLKGNQVIENATTVYYSLKGAADELSSVEPMLGAINKGKPISVLYNFLKGFYIGDNQIFDSSGNLAVPGSTTLTGSITSSGAGTLATGLTVTAGDTNVDNFVQGGDVTSITTSSATYTLTAANICDSSVIKFTPSGAITTVTLPATSTLFADCLTANGDYKDLSYASVSTSTVLAAGTGGTMTISSSSTVQAADTANLRVQRDTATSYLLMITNQL